MKPSRGFRITGDKGFHITFENGWTVSVQFGWGNYCDNHDADHNGKPERGWESGDAETAVWGPDGKMLEVEGAGGDTVQPWRSPTQVLELLNWAASQK